MSTLDVLLEEEEDDDLILLLLTHNNVGKKKVNALFTTRSLEGFSTILINRHLINDEEKFRLFFRLNVNQFNYVLSMIEAVVKREPYNRVRKPITPAEKLAVTLR